MVQTFVVSLAYMIGLGLLFKFFAFLDIMLVNSQGCECDSDIAIIKPPKF